MAVMTTRRSVVRVSDDGDVSRPDDLAVEDPLTLFLNGEALAVLMRTPGHDLELAAGWLVVESDVVRADDIALLRGCHLDGHSRVDITLQDGITPPRPRAFVTSAACGVCSADAVDLAPLRRTPPHSPGWRVDGTTIAVLPVRMRKRQRNFARTGAVHAAAIANSLGDLLVVREDVGRHNAVDKVVGWSLLEGRLPLTDHLLVVSGRVSFEIVQKTVAAGLAGVIAVSAPTSLAVDLARQYDLLLAALVRDGRVNLYAGHQLADAPAPA
jgi:FdhD protein